MPKPHPGWVEIRRRAKRVTHLAAGRRYFKTSGLMAVAVESAAQGKHIIWGAPTFDQVMIGWNEAFKAAGGVARFLKSERIAEFPGGGRIIYRSLDDPDNARGFTADGAIIDEAADVVEEAYYEVIRPMLMTTRGWIWTAGTPKGQNWFWREHMAANYADDTIAFQIPTVGCEIYNGQLIRKPHPLENPYIPFSEIENLFRSMPERSFRQELLSEFISSGGSVFTNVDAVVRTHTCRFENKPCTPDCPGFFPLEPYSGTFVAGLDWGRENDYTDLTIFDAFERKEVDHARFTQIGYDLQRQFIRNYAEKWGLRAILAESNSIGAPNIEALQREGLPIQGFYTTNQTKTHAIEQLVLAIEQKQISLGDIPENEELKAYQQEKLPSGLIRYSAPKGLHDDRVISLMLANLACQVEPRQYKIKLF